MEGYLWKKRKSDPKFQPLQFVLSETEGVLKYFAKEVSKRYLLQAVLLILNV